MNVRRTYRLGALMTVAGN